MFISGSYVASDLFNSNKIDSSDVNFATTVLKYKLDADHASKDGEVYSVNSDFINGFNHISYNTDFNDSIYTVQASDAINSTGGVGLYFVTRRMDFRQLLHIRQNMEL